MSANNGTGPLTGLPSVDHTGDDSEVAEFRAALVKEGLDLDNETAEACLTILSSFGPERAAWLLATVIHAVAAPPDQYIGAALAGRQIAEKTLQV